MTPQRALREYGDRLTQFERKEVQEYEDVWFLGLDAKKTEGVEGAAQNSGEFLPPSLWLVTSSLLAILLTFLFQVMMMKTVATSKTCMTTLPTGMRSKRSSAKAPLDKLSM